MDVMSSSLLFRQSASLSSKMKFRANFPTFLQEKLSSPLRFSPALYLSGSALTKRVHLLNNQHKSSPNNLISELFSRGSMPSFKQIGSNQKKTVKQNLRLYASASSEEEREFDYDLFTIGAGSGGVRASRFSTQYGATAAVCEMPFSTISSDSTGGVGGTCVLRGCVPKKLLVYGAHFHQDFENSKGFGWEFPEPPVHAWSTLIKNKNKELLRLTNAYRNTLSNAKVELIEGRGKIIDAHTVEVNSKKYSAKHILVCTGGRAFVPDIPGKEYVITSDEALDLPSRPDRIVIVGSGYIALEFACIFRNLGSEVHLVYRQPLPLRGFDEEIRQKLTDHLSSMGIILHPEEKPSSVERTADSKLLFFSEKGKKIEAEAVMFATGRKPNTKNLGLENVGVEVDKSGAIIVDEYSRTNVESVWAVGDVTNRLNLTPVALMEGMAFAKTAFLNKPTKPDYKNIACAVFTQPPISVVGLTEEEAVLEYGDIDVYNSSFRPMKATLSASDVYSCRTFMKLIVHSSSDKVVGAHMFGEDAAEIIQGIAIAIKAGCTKSDFDSTVGIHPSSAEEFVTMRSPTRRIRKEKDEENAKQAVSIIA